MYIYIYLYIYVFIQIKYKYKYYPPNYYLSSNLADINILAATLKKWRG